MGFRVYGESVEISWKINQKLPKSQTLGAEGLESFVLHELPCQCTAMHGPWLEPRQNPRKKVFLSKAAPEKVP